MNGPWGAPNAFRVSIGTREQNQMFLETLKQRSEPRSRVKVKPQQVVRDIRQPKGWLFHFGNAQLAEISS